MRPLMNIALITALGLVTMACTVVTDPSSGSSGGSNKTSFMDRQQQISEFARVNLDHLRSDMAAGQGEYLDSLATLLDIAPDRQPAFRELTRERFTTLFPSENTTATEMLATLNREMQTDPSLAQRVAVR
ncbi:MAG: DUF3015 domain-containing protein [Candidatus Competibacteraceae bacterium]|mgnify:FL=1|nr:MAG: DUF3015 domain-containing protein [Candidatus Competibacteraceae bacterium]